MDKKKGLLNVSVSIFFKIALLIGSILVRRFLIKYIGNDVNGLNSLYLSIIGVLSVAELGVGTAIIFCMYKPIVEGDSAKVAALYHLFTKLYLIIGLIIFIGGLIVLPLLPYLAKGYESVDENLYVTFFIMLVSVVLSYIYSSKTSLINAHKNDYITTTINSVGMLLQYGLQIATILIFKSFVPYLICRIVAVCFQWVVTEIVARIKYKSIIAIKSKLDAETKSSVVKNIKAMFMHKIGGVLVNTADSIIISAFISVSVLGKYSNYTSIMTSMVNIITLLFVPLTSVIGHMFVSESKDIIKKYFNFFYTCNFIIGIIFFLGYYAVIDNLVTILFGNNLEMAKSVSFVISLNYFIKFMRQTVELFKDSSGTFYYDRWKPLIEGTVNVILSILFVLWFGVVGVIAATVITTLLINHIVEPYVLYKHALEMPVKSYYIKNYSYIAIFTVALVGLHFCMVDIENQWLELLVNGGISLAFSFVICTIAILINKDFRHYIKVFIGRFKDNFKHKKI